MLKFIYENITREQVTKFYYYILSNVDGLTSHKKFEFVSSQHILASSLQLGTFTQACVIELSDLIWDSITPLF